MVCLGRPNMRYYVHTWTRRWNFDAHPFRFNAYSALLHQQDNEADTLYSEGVPQTIRKKIYSICFVPNVHAMYASYYNGIWFSWQWLLQTRRTRWLQNASLCKNIPIIKHLVLYYSWSSYIFMSHFMHHIRACIHKTIDTFQRQMSWQKANNQSK